MKQTARRYLAMFLALVMCIGVLPVMQIAAANETVDYVTGSNGYIYNWGIRGEKATFLSQNAKAFYSGNNTYDVLSTYAGGTSTSNAPDSKLYDALYDLMESNHSYKTSYDATRDLYQYTDCENSGKDSKAISCFYTGKAIGPTWDAGATWNREHTWPNSKGLNGDDEDDIMMLRPTDSRTNSSRGNKAYGEGSAYYDPNGASSGNLDVRGDVARIFLYVYVRWGNTEGNSEYGTVWGTNGVIESLDVLLKWMEVDPVDTWELGRNDSVESITGTRNVFVDYPEFAFLLFGEDIPENMTTPSGGSGSSGSTTPSEGTTPTEGTTPDTPSTGTTTTVSVMISDYGTANNWAETTKYSTVELDENIVVTANGGGNTGKYYNDSEWRIYQSESGYLTVTAANGTTIKSVKITYNSEKSGVLTYNGVNVTSGTIAHVNASSAEFVVGNTGSATNGQARITAIEVVYETGDQSESTPGETEPTETTPGDTTEPTPAYTISFSVYDGLTAPAAQDSKVALPYAAAPDGYSFLGWVKDPIPTKTTDKPEIFEAGTVYPATEDIKLYAVYSFVEGGTSGYTKTDIADIKSTDVVVITMTKETTTWAMSNDKGTGGTPTAVVVSTNGDALTGNIEDNVLWNISNDNGSLTIYPNGTTATWLYCTSTNNGVRVGTNSSKVFTIDAASGYLKHNGTNRYLGVYTTNPDWRCYTNTTGNTANQTLGFYVLGTGTTYYITGSACSHTFTETVKENVVDATCTEAGSYDLVVYCTGCNEEMSRETIEIPAAHTYTNGECVCGRKDIRGVNRMKALILDGVITVKATVAFMDNNKATNAIGLS
ncbi:MAG: hypothetical protein E7470_05955, partial [Ruminococcaceae bacterium]|nr:hypothetical protein [Oscillospiraceae bacterium]